MSEIMIALISLAGTLLVAEPILFYSIYRKLKKAQVTDANADNSLKLIEVQDKYIDLIEDKDNKIDELKKEVLEQSKTIIYYQTLHCVHTRCPKRQPPLGNLLRPQEGKITLVEQPDVTEDNLDESLEEEQS